ncbi:MULTISPECIES: phage major capsid protein [unclassified Herbaspirillum]|uniref:phage major capsid protein n=1 Tax=unclassified Herbaspirillum TaxID=2624150 RepID=UPI000E2F77CE|nr:MULTISPECIES: phage major capsid protein [unclassified Herbaspirillum]RFB73828.1 phage major capsid protein [Herbaspirillum sp. 3R-3a1]TFI10361.1 phage major capsid protein [Herbaspirillum sp. 3R11]TFI16265.1 phage major capsid protein [Herbaspirillum sp. 3R-11]TFI28362.1 phage major capsid protein [Herbaspirillum sp. 3C11]
MDLKSLLQARAGVQAKIAGIAAKEAAGTALSAEEISEFGALSAEFEALTDKINRLQASERMSAAVATPVQSPLYAQPKAADKRKPGESLGIMVRSLISSKGDVRAAANFAETECQAPDIAAALNTTTNTAGGFIIPPGYVPEVIELLRPNSVIRSLGARTMPMPAGTLSMAKIASGSNASYVGEGVDIPKSEPTFGNLNLSKKKLVAMVPVSNDLVRFSSPSANEIVRDDIVQGLGTREDQAFIRDDGTGNTPKGLRALAIAANVIPANAVINAQNVKNDAGKLELALMGKNVKMIKPGWVFSPRTLVFLTNLLDGNGNHVFPEIATGNWRGKPYKTTTSVPDNLGDNGDESEIYLTDFNDAIIGEATGLIIDVSGEASYVENGTLVSAFSRDQTVVRAITEHDFGLRHDPSTAVLTGVKWKP